MHPRVVRVSVIDLSQSSIDITREICDIDSVSDREGPLADLIERTARSLEHLTVSRHGDTIVARTTLGRAQRVVIAGHIDTVPINENLPTRFETIDGVDYLWGRGTVDMKAGVAVQLKLAAELTAPKVDITWIWYDHEEVSESKNGLNKLSQSNPELLAGDFAILSEPTRSEIEGGCNGNLRAEIRTRGLRSHSARSWVGDNAIHKAAPILNILADYEAEQIEVDGLVYREGLNAVGVTGGIAGNVIPDECMVHVNYRFAPSKSGEEAVAHIHELFGDYEIEIVDLAVGARPGLDAPIAQQFVAAVGGTPMPKYGWTDVARFSRLGVPAINYGPGDPMKAHADDERVPLQQITDCERGLRAWLSGSAS